MPCVAIEGDRDPLLSELDAMDVQAQKEAAKEALFAANIGVGGDMLSLLSEDNPDGVVMITEDGKITFVNRVCACQCMLLSDAFATAQQAVDATISVCICCRKSKVCLVT